MTICIVKHQRANTAHFWGKYSTPGANTVHFWGKYSTLGANTAHFGSKYSTLWGQIQHTCIQYGKYCKFLAFDLIWLCTITSNKMKNVVDNMYSAAEQESKTFFFPLFSLEIVPGACIPYLYYELSSNSCINDCFFYSHMFVLRCDITENL